MGQSPQYSYGAISGMDYRTLMNNPYLLAALQSPNVNFKANETSQTTNPTGAGLTTTAQTTASDGAIPVNYAIAEPDSSNTGLWVTGTIGAAALIACAAKGKGGNIIDGAKKIFGGLFKSSKKKAADVVSNKLQNIQVIKRGKTIECFVPGEKFTIKGNDKVLNHLNTYGINPKSITGLNEGETVLNGGVFNRKGYEITFEGNKITKILDKSGKDVTAQYFGRGVKLDDKKRNFISSAII